MSILNPTTRTYIINKIISDNNLGRYLEIGVSNPYTNFLSINCDRKVSVDPCIECEHFPTDAIETFKPFITHQMMSDDFFAKNTEIFDIVFIDGDHSYLQSLTDLNNALKIIPVGGFIVLHDAMPSNFDATQIKSFEKKLPYNGEVWKTVVSAIRATNGELQVGTFPYDFGVTVIKKLTDNIPHIAPMDLDYNTDYNVPALNPIYNLLDFKNKKVSYFTGLFNTPQKQIERTAKTVINQTNKNWEWVLHDDSNNENDAARLEKFFAALNNPKIKYYRMNAQTNGSVGMSKKRAANLCAGDYLAELDHDDLLMPNITDKILQHGDGYDFIYSNAASIIIDENESFTQGEHFAYRPGFAMGYGAYRTTNAINPLTGNMYKYQECITVPINPKTIRQIVSAPNHIRVWAKHFYDSIGGHNIDMGVADDYELVIRSFLAGGKFLHLDMLGYLQVEHTNRTTYNRNLEIQILWNSVLTATDIEIKQEFELRGISDWAYKYHLENLGFTTFQTLLGHASALHYWDVPSILNAPCANDRV